MNELLHKELGADLKLDITFDAGKLKLIMSYDNHGITAGTSVAVSAKFFLDQLVKAIPGDLDDKVVGALELAMGIV